MGRETREEGGRQRVSARGRAEQHKTGFQSTAYAVPDGHTEFRVKAAGVKRMSILPYKAGGPESKGGKNPFADVGMLHYERTYFVHRGIGPNEDSYVCPNKTVGKRCPICEARVKLAKDPDVDPKLAEGLAPKERQLFWVLDEGEPDKGAQLWDMSYHLFGKQLDARIKNSDPDDEYEYFSDPVDGSVLKVGFKEKSFGGNTFYETETIDFKKRGEPLAKAFKALPSLDDCLIIQPYDKLRAIFLQVAEDGGEPEEPKAKTKAPPPEDDDEPAPKPKAKAPPPADDEDAPAPAKPKRPAADDDWEEEAPKPKAKTKAPPAEEDEPPPKPKAKAPAVDDDWE